MDAWDEAMYRQGRIDQARWLMDRLVNYVKAHPELPALLPSGFRDFFVDLLEANVQEAAHGTRVAEPVQSGV